MKRRFIFRVKKQEVLDTGYYKKQIRVHINEYHNTVRSRFTNNKVTLSIS